MALGLTVFLGGRICKPLTAEKSVKWVLLTLTVFAAVLIVAVPEPFPEAGRCLKCDTKKFSGAALNIAIRVGKGQRDRLRKRLAVRREPIGGADLAVRVVADG